jgi:autotransporter-associated beta strand protein
MKMLVSSPATSPSALNALLLSHGWRRRVLQDSILAVTALSFSHSGFADILGQYTFGPDGSTPGILSPTTIGSNLSVSSISADSGLTLDLTNPAVVPISTPYLRTVPVIASTTPQAAVSNQADFKFTLTADPGFLLNFSSLTFDVMRGGASTPRGYEVRSSVDDFATSLGAADVPTARPEFTPIAIDLSGATFQNLPSITFKIYAYTTGTGASLDFDNIVANGVTVTLPPTGYTWTGNANGNWDTTSANWSERGTIYVDGTPNSDVVFADGPTRTTINVSPTAVNPHAIAFTNATANYIFQGSAITVIAGIGKSGLGSVTFNNSVSAATVGMSAGTTFIGTGGTLTSPLINVGSAAILDVAAGGSLGATSGLVVNGTVTLNNASQNLATLSGGNLGALTLNGTAINVSGASSYDGRISGTGSIVKNTSGTLTLNGLNDFSGGITISSGAVQLGAATAAGTTPVVVNTGGTLAMAVTGTPSTTPIVLNGGLVGSVGNQTVAADVTVNSASAVAEFNPITGATGADFIITGMLLGSGNIDVQTRNANAPDSSAFRLRGPASTYSGTITVPQSGKFELQTSSTSGSPMGTGTLVVTGGSTTTTAAGTYSIVNVRNLSGAGLVSDTDFGNNVLVTGFGTSYFNLLGDVAAGSTVKFGDLLIGDGQALGAVATGSQSYTVSFNTVHLNGGNVTFTPQPVGNANFLSTENIRLGTVTENSPSGITMDGAATLTFGGPATYSGATIIRSGTVVVAGSIVGSSRIALDGGTLTGGGSVSSPVTVGDNDFTTTATINPGGLNEIGTLSVGATSFNNPDAQFQIELNSTDLTTDRLVIAGALELGTATAQLIALDLGFSTLNSGETFIIATAGGGVTGTFMNYPQGATVLVGTNSLTISYLNNQIVLSAVPEPTSAMLLGAAGALVGLRPARRRVSARQPAFAG